jgi:DNA mismatch repair protein MutL
VAARIAAGEVVERPASIVKELVENSLDAGATRIAVEITAGGTDCIRVIDDGCGIDAGELFIAFQRHATSKLEGGEDLSQILTLGFRGEALPSIAAVSEVEAVSRPPGSEGAAAIMLGPDVEPATSTRGGAPGTSISVRRLFERQPARRKFLRSPASEATAVASVVTHYAMAYPELRFSLTVDGRKTLSTPGTGDLRDAIAAVYGAEVAAAMLMVAPGEGPVQVTGLVAPPHISRAGRGYVSLFVNRRWIQSRRLTFAVEEACKGLLMMNRRPIAVINLRVPYEEVDVNVHPTKAEVRFRDESAVFAAVQRAVRRGLLERSPVPGVELYGGAGTAGPALRGQPSMPPLWRHAVEIESRVAGGVAVIGGHRAESRVASTPVVALPALRVIGQFGAVYIVAEGPDGMYLIDQHAAHERVLYERFVALRARREPESQGLLEPVTVDLSPGQRVALSRESEGLREHGMEIEAFGDGAFVVRAVPKSLAAGDVREGVARLLELVIEEGELEGRDRVAMSLACHGAVRAGKTLALEEIRDLVRQLEDCETPNTCPHGRPTMIHMSADLLAREFGRR